MRCASASGHVPIGAHEVSPDKASHRPAPPRWGVGVGAPPPSGSRIALTTHARQHPRPVRPAGAAPPNPHAPGAERSGSRDRGHHGQASILPPTSPPRGRHSRPSPPAPPLPDPLRIRRQPSPIEAKPATRQLRLVGAGARDRRHPARGGGQRPAPLPECKRGRRRSGRRASSAADTGAAVAQIARPARARPARR